MWVSREETSRVMVARFGFFVVLHGLLQEDRREFQRHRNVR